MMNIATIGTGFIADAILSAINEVDGVKCTAIYSRKRETGEPLADKYGVQTIYTESERALCRPECGLYLHRITQQRIETLLLAS